MGNNVKYHLTMTPEQLDIVKRACEFYSRIKFGQFNEIVWEVLDPRRFKDDFSERRDMMEERLFSARLCAFPELISKWQSYGLGYDDDADTAWNAYQAMRYTEAWHVNPEGGNTVNFNKPIDLSSGKVGIPQCTCEEE